MRKQVAFIAAFIMLLSSVVVLGNFTARVKADETTTAYCLELQDLKALAKDGEGNDTGIYWNVSFSYNSTGYFSNDIPAEGNISMEYDSIQESRIDVPGEVFGIGRGMQKNKFIMSEPNGAFGFHYNGWCTSFSPVGFNKIVYDASTHGATHNGSVINKHNIGYGNDFAGVDASARYFAIQWLGGTYSATLENMKIYDESGWDLGVYLDNGNINSGSAQRFVEENKTVVIRPSDETRDIIKIKFQNSEGQQIIGEAYDNLNVVNNQDGTYSFEMPSYALNVAADTKPKTASLLNLTNAVAKAQHVFHDVEFAYNESGYISNNAPAVGNITMQYSATATDRVSVPGEVMGIARGAEKISSSTLTDPRGAFGFHFNGGDSTFTPVGNSNIVYDTATHSAMHNGNVLNKHGYIYANDFAGIETSARYFGIQWLGGTYSAKLENMKIYDESGWDLGVYLSTGNQLSGHVRKLATTAETIVIKPELLAGGIFTNWIIKDSSGNPYNLEITEITEGDLKGYYSFVMPAEEINIEAKFKDIEVTYEQGNTVIFPSSNNADIKALIKSVDLINSDGTIYRTLSSSEYDVSLDGKLEVGFCLVTVTYVGTETTSTINIYVTAIILGSIEVSFEQGDILIYTNDTMATLKKKIKDAISVKGINNDNSFYENGEEINLALCILSGDIQKSGQSTITLMFSGKADTFTINVIDVTYKVSILDNEDTIIKEVTIVDGELLEYSDLVVPEGYIFDGLYLDVEFTKKYDDTKGVIKDLVLYSKWTKESNPLIAIIIIATIIGIVSAVGGVFLLRKKK